MITETLLRPPTAELFAEQLMQSVSAALDVFAIYLGDRLGFYRVLAEDGPLSPGQLAARTGANERYVREWLEHQAVAGVLDVETSFPRERRFYLPPERAEVLADPDSLNYMAPLAQLTAGVVAPLEQIVRVYREGGGLCFHEFGRDARQGQARINRPAFLKQLGPQWIAAMPDVRRRLLQSPGARIADVGCGAGWSSIGLALTYPLVTVDGFDSDADSIRDATGNAVEAGVSPRVTFSRRDAADPALTGFYDLVLAAECVHDMCDPVNALRTMRRLTREGGAVVVIDEKVGDRFDPQAGLVEKFMYGCSILHCLPSAMAEQPAAGTGTVMRADTFRGYAKEAGFRQVEDVPIDHPFLRMYRLYA
ncbi:MAG: methyltransferase domain-containing protein [Bryobacteraceae bacterium]|nr:methyltransferase domain-containing protein [Bryobacteraceae bacterium]